MPTAMSMIWDALSPMLSRFEGLMKALLGVTRPNTMIRPMTTMPIQNADEPRTWARTPVASSGPSASGRASGSVAAVAAAVTPRPPRRASGR